MDLSFGCKSVSSRLSNGYPLGDNAGTPQSWQFVLTGLCCFDDRHYFPDPEERVFDTEFLLKLQRTPLTAKVRAVPVSDWHNLVTRYQASGWGGKWGKDSQGRELDADVLTRLRARFNAVGDEAWALIIYVPPMHEYGGGDDATVEINLKMTDRQIADWNAVTFKFLGARRPNCELTVYNVMFAGDDLASADCGHPTWDRFMETHPAPGEGYALEFARLRARW